jgi:hypothetical protein
MTKKEDTQVTLEDIDDNVNYDFVALQDTVWEAINYLREESGDPEMIDDLYTGIRKLENSLFAYKKACPINTTSKAVVPQTNGKFDYVISTDKTVTIGIHNPKDDDPDESLTFRIDPKDITQYVIMQETLDELGGFGEDFLTAFGHFFIQLRGK